MGCGRGREVGYNTLEQWCRDSYARMGRRVSGMVHLNSSCLGPNLQFCNNVRKFQSLIS